LQLGSISPFATLWAVIINLTEPWAFSPTPDVIAVKSSGRVGSDEWGSLRHTVWFSEQFLSHSFARAKLPSDAVLPDINAA
jgi:hypothetical protein